MALRGMWWECGVMVERQDLFGEQEEGRFEE